MKRLLAAASDWRTLIWLGAGIIAAAALSNPFPALIGLGLYLFMLQRVAKSPRLAEAAEQARIAEQLEQHYQTLLQTMRAVSGSLPTAPRRGESRSWAIRAQEVVQSAIALYREWQAKPVTGGEQAKWVEEALRLGHHYLRILRAYQEVSVRGVSNPDLQAMRERLMRNQQRLAQTVDMEARQLLMQAIEMDERVLQQEGDEAAETERYLAKLAAIESSLDMLRRRVYEPDATEDGTRVHDLLQEAEAMDEALDEVQNRPRVRA